MGCRISMDSRKSQIGRAYYAEIVFSTLFWMSMHPRLFEMGGLRGVERGLILIKYVPTYQ